MDISIRKGFLLDINMQFICYELTVMKELQFIIHVIIVIIEEKYRLREIYVEDRARKLCASYCITGLEFEIEFDQVYQGYIEPIVVEYLNEFYS